MKQAKAAADQPKTLDALVAISDLAIGHRFQDRIPRLSDVARIVALASRVLRFGDIDERISAENAAVLAQEAEPDLAPA
jgi:hypothetical protein